MFILLAMHHGILYIHPLDQVYGQNFVPHKLYLIRRRQTWAHGADMVFFLDCRMLKLDRIRSFRFSNNRRIRYRIFGSGYGSSEWWNQATFKSGFKTLVPHKQNIIWGRWDSGLRSRIQIRTLEIVLPVLLLHNMV